MALKIKLPKEPINGFEVRYFTISPEHVTEIRLKYHLNSKWSDVCEARGGADFMDEWQVFTDGFFSGRVDGWLTLADKDRTDDFETRDEAVAALKAHFERRALQADERAQDYRAKAAQVE